MAHCNMIEQYQVLVQLPHVTHMGNNWNAKLLAEQTDGDKLTYTSYPYSIHLDKTS